MKQLPTVVQVPTITVFQIYALERAINDLRTRGHSLQTPDDPWAGLLLHEDAEQLEALLAILKPAAAPLRAVVQVPLPRAGASNPMWLANSNAAPAKVLHLPSDDTEGGAA